MIDKNNSHDIATEQRNMSDQEEKTREIPANLDELIELLNEDDLRNVVGGMARPKGRFIQD